MYELQFAARFIKQTRLFDLFGSFAALFMEFWQLSSVSLSLYH